MKILNTYTSFFYGIFYSLLVFLLPVVVHAQGGVVPCGGPDCGYDDFMVLINNVIETLIGIAVAVSALLFMYAGFLYLTAGGNENQADRAKDIFGNVAIGFGIILVAWLVVSMIVGLLTSCDWRAENRDIIPITLETEDCG